MARLARDCRNIVGVKEASGSLDQMSQVILACGPEFSVLSGDDNITLPLLAIGGRGVISVIANIMPRETSEMVLPGDESHSHQGSDGDGRDDRARVPPAHVPHGGGQSREAAGNPQDLRSREVAAVP